MNKKDNSDFAEAFPLNPDAAMKAVSAALEQMVNEIFDDLRERILDSYSDPQPRAKKRETLH